jgi:4,5-DOPA dioxygenase extradiol
VASGNVVHNLRLLQWNRPDASFDWAEEFDEAAIDVMVNRPAQAPGLTAHHRYAIAAPSAEHFLPLLYIAGLASASASDSSVSTLVTGQSMGSLSMTSFLLDRTTQ